MLASFPPPYGAPPPPPPPGPPGPFPPPPPPVGSYAPAGFRPAPGGAPGPSGRPSSGHQAGHHGSHSQQSSGHRRQDPPPGFRSVPHGGKPGSHRGQPPPPQPSSHNAAVSSIVPLAVENRLRRDTPFLAHIRFRNDLPEIPSDPKMLVSQVQPELLARFALTAMERQARRDLLTPPNIVISPLDVQRYQVPDHPGPMDPADAALLKEESRPLAIGGSPMPAAADGRNKSFAARSKGMDVDKCSWLMRTTYISSSDNRGAQKQGLPEKQVLQARAAERRGAAAADERELNDRDAQVTAIEASFEAARAPPVHTRNPALRPVDIMPILPDMDMWPQKLLLTTFHDSDPADEVAAVVGPAAMAAMPPAKRPHLLVGHYLFKGFTHRISKAGRERELKIMALLVREDVGQMVARTAAAAAQNAAAAAAAGAHTRVAEGKRWTKDYNYDLKRDSMHYALRLDKGGARFYRMQGKLELRSWRDEEKLARDRSRKRVMGRAGSEEPGEEELDGSDQVQRPVKIRVTTRDFTERELQEREERRRELEPQL
ncbi:RNA polymerase II-associated factor 1, partial [Tetrabaena socialis]